MLASKPSIEANRKRETQKGQEIQQANEQRASCSTSVVADSCGMGDFGSGRGDGGARWLPSKVCASHRRQPLQALMECGILQQKQLHHRKLQNYCRRRRRHHHQRFRGNFAGATEVA